LLLLHLIHGCVGITKKKKKKKSGDQLKKSQFFSFCADDFPNDAKLVIIGFVSLLKHCNSTSPG
jgi:hypothetical protein